MVWSMVAKMEYKVVERVVKIWSLMGSWWRNEEEEGGKDGVMVVVVVEMKEEMEENEVVVEFVVKMEGKWWRNGWPNEARAAISLLVRCREWRRKKRKSGRERRSGGIYT